MRGVSWRPERRTRRKGKPRKKKNPVMTNYQRGYAEGYARAVRETRRAASLHIAEGADDVDRIVSGALYECEPGDFPAVLRDVLWCMLNAAAQSVAAGHYTDEW